MSPKVTYFNGRGLAEPIRIILKYANVDFEDVRIERENWPALKPSTPFGQMPIYEEDGKVTYQSIAIVRYLAKKYNLVGDNDWENLEIDAVVDTVSDLRMKAVPIFLENDPDKKEILKQTFLTETLPYYMERFEKIAGDNNGHIAVNKFTWADIFFTTCADLINVVVGVDVLQKYQNLQKVRQNVVEHPNIKPWIESRPETPF